MNPNKTTGPFSIPVVLLKILKNSISCPLEMLFNNYCSFTSGIVPDHFKVAKVISDYKEGSSLVVTNYRPISLLSIFNKILERLVYNRLIKYFDKSSTSFDQQLGSRSSHSAVHALTLMIDKIQRAIDSKNYSCGIFIDLCKAFDTVDHHILLDKLEYYGIRGIAHEWFSSYLPNRSQFVSLGHVESGTRQILCGVPQDSVLGPLLFLLYVNDLHNLVPRVSLLLVPWSERETLVWSGHVCPRIWDVAKKRIVGGAVKFTFCLHSAQGRAEGITSLRNVLSAN